MFLTPLMHSTLVTSHHSAHFPPMKSLLFHERGYQCNGVASRGQEDKPSRFHRQQGVTGTSLAETHITPKSEMNGVHANPRTKASLISSTQLDLVPGVSSNAAPYPTPQNSKSSHSRQRSGPEPFYNTYYSARQKSPIVKKEPGSSNHQGGQRRASGDTNAIASYLQIPLSINSSKGSLPEFAAKVSSCRKS